MIEWAMFGGGFASFALMVVSMFAEKKLRSAEGRNGWVTVAQIATITTVGLGTGGLGGWVASLFIS